MAKQPPSKEPEDRSPRDQSSQGKSSELADRFRSAMTTCERLYVASANRCLKTHPHLIKQPPDKFRQLMLDLHRGLLVKIYMTIVQADGKWTTSERELAEVMLEHIWGRRIEGDELREAMQYLIDKSNELNWYQLFRPFEMPPLRSQITLLEKSVLHVAEVVAIADGTIHASEALQIKGIQEQLQRHLIPLPIESPEDEASGSQAIAKDSEGVHSPSTPFDLEEKGTKARKAYKRKKHKKRMAKAIEELAQLIGLKHVKRDVNELINFLKIQEERVRAGLPQADISHHMVFTGNPGTGKTSVGRIIGEMYGAMGLLAKGHLIETDRSGLVAEFSGQTGPKTNKIIDAALDGVLFIDEAYSLVAERGDDPYGSEAIQALLKRMEDERDRLIVILAGYPAPMERLLKTNPGLSSRFNRRFHFPDYTAEELLQIFQRMCRINKYAIPKPTQQQLMRGFRYVLEDSDEHFGNGRMVRNVFESAIRRLANRIAHVSPLTKKILTTLEPEDIVIKGLPDSLISATQGEEQ